MGTKTAVLPWNPIKAYFKDGTNRWTKDDFFRYINFSKQLNPVIISPFENKRWKKFNTKILPVKSKQGFVQKCREENVELVYTYKCDRHYHLGINMAYEAKKQLDIPLLAMAFNTKRDGPIPDSLKEADRIDAISKAVYEYLYSQGVKEQKLKKVPIGRKADVFKPIDTSDNEIFTILSVAVNASERKNFDNMVKAFKKVENIHWKLIGGMSKTAISSEYQLDNSPNISILGKVSRKKLVEEYNKSDAFYLPSRWEGQGLVFVESLLCDTPVITSDRPPMNDIIISESTGTLADPENIEDIAKKIEKAQKSSFNGCRERGLMWSWKNIQPQREKLIEEII